MHLAVFQSRDGILFSNRKLADASILSAQKRVYSSIDGDPSSIYWNCKQYAKKHGLPRLYSVDDESTPVNAISVAARFDGMYTEVVPKYEPRFDLMYIDVSVKVRFSEPKINMDNYT